MVGMKWWMDGVIIWLILFHWNMFSCLVDEAGGMSVMMITERNIPLLSSCCGVCRSFVELSSMRSISIELHLHGNASCKQEHQRILFDSKSFSTISLLLAWWILASDKCRHISKLWNRIICNTFFVFVGLHPKLSLSFWLFCLQIWNLNFFSL